MDIFTREIDSRSKLIKCTLSDSTSEFKKVIIRPVLIKEEKFWQFEKFKNKQVFHTNIPDDKFNTFLLNIIQDYKQICFDYEGFSNYYAYTRGRYVKSVKANNLRYSNLTHNRNKNYILQEGSNIPALVDLGVFDSKFNIIKSKYDKFKQINRFLELIDDAFKKVDLDEITILDFGCGKSYLTFIIYYYFVEVKKIKAKVIGYDLKEDVVEKCNLIAQKYGYNNLKFFVNDVTSNALYTGKIDMIITLHACDVATDFALDYAIKNNVNYIFSVPCCQHEINKQIKMGGDFDILLKHGLIKERFSALLTDAIRAELLNKAGYSVDMLEFVDFEHSPKNIMIRAKKVNKRSNKDVDLDELLDKYKFKQTLNELLKK